METTNIVQGVGGKRRGRPRDPMSDGDRADMKRQRNREGVRTWRRKQRERFTAEQEALREQIIQTTSLNDDQPEQVKPGAGILVQGLPLPVDDDTMFEEALQATPDVTKSDDSEQEVSEGEAFESDLDSDAEDLAFSDDDGENACESVDKSSGHAASALGIEDTAVRPPEVKRVLNSKADTKRTPSPGQRQKLMSRFIFRQPPVNATQPGAVPSSMAESVMSFRSSPPDVISGTGLRSRGEPRAGQEETATSVENGGLMPSTQYSRKQQTSSGSSSKPKTIASRAKKPVLDSTPSRDVRSFFLPLLNKGKAKVTPQLDSMKSEDGKNIIRQGTESGWENISEFDASGTPGAPEAERIIEDHGAKLRERSAAATYDRPNDDIISPMISGTSGGDMVSHIISDRSEAEAASANGVESGFDVNFNNASRRKSGSSISSEEGLEETDYTLATARRLIQQLRDFQGCSPAKHLADMAKHKARGLINHNDLAAAVRGDIPNVLNYEKTLLEQKTTRMPSPGELREAFEGGHSQRWGPRHICLHAEKTSVRPPQLAYDVDSFMGFASSLGVAKQGITLLPAPQKIQNIHSHLHIGLNVEYMDETGKVHVQTNKPLRDIPHFQFARINGEVPVDLYVLFPRLINGSKVFTALSNEQLERWWRCIVTPAIYDSHDSHVTQHIQPTFGDGLRWSKAKQTEMRLNMTGGYQTQQQLGIFLQADVLDDVWQAMILKVRSRPDCRDFEDMQLYFAAKGIKLKYKTGPNRPSLLQGMEFYEAAMHQMFDTKYTDLDEFWIDQGKETCAPDHCIYDRKMEKDKQAQIYLYRTCCIKSFVENMYEGKGVHRFYQVALLNDAANVSSVPARGSTLQLGGLACSQLYASYKEALDAAKTYPFANIGLEELALDPKIRRTFANAAESTPRSVEVLQRAYAHCKVRLSKSTMHSVNKSFGVREEYRITLRLFLAIMKLLREDEDIDAEETTTEVLPYVWPVRTKLFMKYLWGNANKFAAGFELVANSCAPAEVTWEQTKSMIMFLRCLRYCTGSSVLAEDSSLWTGKIESENGAWHGLGFGASMKKFGYAWMRPLMDWKQLIFKEKYSRQIRFGNFSLALQYKARWESIRNIKTNYINIEACRGWMSRYKSNEARAEVIKCMIHLCLQQFRLDVTAYLNPSDKELQREILEDKVQLCVDDIARILGEEPYLVKGNKTKAKSFYEVFEQLWGTGTIVGERKGWKNKPYRVLYQTAEKIVVAGLEDRNAKAVWKSSFYEELHKYHWVYPVPEAIAGCFVSKEKGKRKWWSLLGGGSNTLKWGGAKGRKGPVPPLPAFTKWSYERWELYLDKF